VTLTTLQNASWRPAVKRLPGVQSLINLAVALEDWWFDFHHNVDTSSQLRDQEERGWRRDAVNFHYLPIRPKCARRVLRNLVIPDRRQYTFIDFGSGKGRMLLMAAQAGFGHVCGVELRQELHKQAVQNFRQYAEATDCTFDSLNMDAADFEFPNRKLVLFFFNPFGSEVMMKVVSKLIVSLDVCARDIWIVLHDSSSSYLVDNTSRFKVQLARHGYRIYRSI